MVNGKRGALSEKASAMNKTPLELVPEVVMKHGGSLRLAAFELGCAVNTVRYWLLKAGFVAKQQGYTWEKQV